MGDSQYKVFVGGISWQMDDAALKAGARPAPWQRVMRTQISAVHVRCLATIPHA
jgi:hypothetical protein